jgi:hypothetical protein
MHQTISSLSKYTACYIYFDKCQTFFVVGIRNVGTCVGNAYLPVGISGNFVYQVV